LGEKALKTRLFLASLMGMLLLASTSAKAQLEQDLFVASKGEGRGRTREQALDRAKKDAVMAVIVEKLKEKGLEEFSEDRVGIRDVMRNSAQYIGRVDVLSSKASRASSGKGEKGRKGSDPRDSRLTWEVKVSASINVSRLMRDFEKARQIAALRVYGEKVAAILHEEIDPGDGKDPVPRWDFMGAIGVERTFMMYKFRPLSMGRVRDRFQAEVEAGKTMKEDGFRIEIVEALASIGAHVRIVGGVTLFAVEDAKDADGNPLKGFTASWWAQVHVGDRYHRRVAVEAEKEKGKGPTGRGATVEEAEETAFKAAGEDLAFDLAGLLAEKLEEIKEAEGDIRDVTFVAEAVPANGFRALEGALHGIEGILNVKRLRVGRGVFIAKLTTTLEPRDLDEALEAALGPLGISSVESTETKVKFRGGN